MMKKKQRLPNIGQVLADNATCVDSLKTRIQIPQTAAEKAAANYPVGKQAADGGTLAQKLERINIKHAYIAGFESRQPEVDKLKEVLHEAKLQIEYLHHKFAETGTGNAVLSRIESLL